MVINYLNILDIENSKINDELKEHKSKIISNEIMINQHEKMLYLLYQTNEKQKEKIHKQDIELNNHQDMIINCLSNIKNLYQESQELKNNILLEEKKLNEYTEKNDKEILNLKSKCEQGISQINNVIDVLNSHTETLAEHSTMIAQLQALSIKHDENIEEIKKIFSIMKCV